MWLKETSPYLRIVILSVRGVCQQRQCFRFSGNTVEFLYAETNEMFTGALRFPALMKWGEVYLSGSVQYYVFISRAVSDRFSRAGSCFCCTYQHLVQPFPNIRTVTIRNLHQMAMLCLNKPRATHQSGPVQYIAAGPRQHWFLVPIATGLDLILLSDGSLYSGTWSSHKTGSNHRKWRPCLMWASVSPGAVGITREGPVPRFALRVDSTRQPC